jgi:uncharacterized membrane protein YwaF
MVWGSFGIVHFATLILGAAMVVALYFLLRGRSRRLQTTVLGVLSFSGLAAVVYNLLMWGSPLEYLPLHLCSINAMLLPVVVFTRSRTLGNLLLVWSLGALAALIVNNALMDAELLSWRFFFYYFPHVMEFGIPILLFKLDLVKKDPKCIGSTLALTMGIYTVVHLINKGINAWCAAEGIMRGEELLQVNYMYSVTPEFPVLALFYRVIPCEYWYMYMVVPIVAAYLLLVYAPQLLRKRSKV